MSHVLSLTAIGGKFSGGNLIADPHRAINRDRFFPPGKYCVCDESARMPSFFRKLPFETLANHSIIQTLGRSINTQLMTSEFMLLALALLGGVTLQQFAIILLLGLLSGTYSSIFIAAPSLVIWQNQEWTTWFKGSKTNDAA